MYFYKKVFIPLLPIIATIVTSCAAINPNYPLYNYQLDAQKEQLVDGKQGIAMDDKHYFVSDNQTLVQYDLNFQNKKKIDVNQYFNGNVDPDHHHIGDIDVYNDIVCTVGENFENNVGTNIEVALFRASDLAWLNTVDIFPDYCGLKEISGVTFDPTHNLIWFSSWTDKPSGQYLYYYQMNDFKYLGKLQVEPWVQNIQGIKYYNNFIFASCDDSKPWSGEKVTKDHLYRIDPKNGHATLEHTFNEFADDKETEGLTINPDTNEFLIMQNIDGGTLNFFKTTKAQ